MNGALNKTMRIGHTAASRRRGARLVHNRCTNECRTPSQARKDRSIRFITIVSIPIGYAPEVALEPRAEWWREGSGLESPPLRSQRAVPAICRAEATWEAWPFFPGATKANPPCQSPDMEQLRTLGGSAFAIGQQTVDNGYLCLESSQSNPLTTH